MSETIKKLNKLHNPESFIQINTIKGFKYVDRAGEIVNEYHKKNVEPSFAMGLDGLVIEKPLDKVEQLKITPRIMWMKFSEVDSLDMVSNLFANEASKLLPILEISQVKRVGWRNFFIYDFKNKNEQKKYFEKLSKIKNAKFLSGVFEVNTSKDFKVSLMLQPVTKNDEAKTAGVLFDVDVYKNGEIDLSDISAILKDFREYLSDEKGFIEIINNTFSE